MLLLRSPLGRTLFALSFLIAPLASAKDEVVALEQCPPPVQAVIRHYSAQATLEEIGLDKKAKSGGPAVYEAKFAVKDGSRIEVHIAADGRVVGMEKKKSKN
jgi:hypothetical protein